MFRRTGSTPKILVVERTTAVDPKWGGKLCQLPKGAVGFGETLEQAALREVREETGYQGIIITKVGVASWCYERGGCQWVEEVHYFLMINKSDIPEERDYEFEYVTWMSIAEAADKLSYPEEKEILHEFVRNQTKWIAVIG